MTRYHHVPGRLRVRIARLKKNPELANTVCRLLASMPGVRASEANPLTGSLVIRYDSHATTPENLIGQIVAAGYQLEQSHAESSHVPVTRTAGPNPRRRLARKAATVVAWYVVEKAIERSLPKLVLALL